MMVDGIHHGAAVWPGPTDLGLAEDKPPLDTELCQISDQEFFFFM